MMICMISMVSIGCGRSNQDSGKKVTINILNYKGNRRHLAKDD